MSRPSSQPSSQAPGPPAGLPAPLLVAASLVLVEGLVVVLLGVAEVFAFTPGRLTMGLTTALFFVLCGVGLVLVAWGLRTLRGWSRAPAVLGQLMLLLLAWSFRDVGLVALPMALAAVVALIGVLHPASIALLTAEHRLAADEDRRA